jgi:hypothetical protein
MANAGGAWDNAKKYIETEINGGKSSFAHTGAVVGDIVGDLFKDTSGPSMNILIKLMTIVSIVFAPLINNIIKTYNYLLTKPYKCYNIIKTHFLQKLSEYLVRIIFLQKLTRKLETKFIF